MVSSLTRALYLETHTHDLIIEARTFNFFTKRIEYPLCYSVRVSKMCLGSTKSVIC